MKRTNMLAMFLILAFILLALIGCKELKEMKASLVEDVDGTKHLAAYENKIVMIFVYNSDKDYFLNVFNFDSNQYACFGIEFEGKYLGGTKYFAYRSDFQPQEWDDKNGILVMYPPFGGETRYVNKREFFKMIQPFMTKVLEQKRTSMGALREAAIAIGLLEDGPTV